MLRDVDVSVWRACSSAGWTRSRASWMAATLVSICLWMEALATVLARRAAFAGSLDVTVTSIT